MKNIFKKATCAVVALSVAASLCTANVTADAVTDDLAVFDDYNQSEITSNMGLGINLGNELEAVWEGSNWGYDEDITPEFFALIKEEGFSTVRIPVGWLSHIGDEASDYKVDETWLARVKEVVDMAQASGLYTVINMHSDGYHTINGAWLFCDASDDEQVAIKAKYESVWTQIGDYFKDYDEHLIFESMNEEFDNTYSAPSTTAKKKAYQNINAYNQIFVDSVRGTGSNNEKRWLLMPGWNTNISYTVNSEYGFELPDDTKCTADSPRMMVSVHYYDPYNFTINEDANTIKTQWGQYADPDKAEKWDNEGSLAAQFESLYTAFTSNNIPVIIGEFAAMDRSSMDEMNPEFRRYYLETVVKVAKSYGCIPVYWDNGYNGKNGMGLFDKTNNTVTQQGAIDGMVRAITATGEYTIPAPGDNGNLSSSSEPVISSSSEIDSSSVVDSSSSSSVASSTSSKAAANNTTTTTNATTSSNPSTGMAAGSVAIVALAAAGLIVAKKKK